MNDAPPWHSKWSDWRPGTWILTNGDTLNHYLADTFPEFLALSLALSMIVVAIEAGWVPFDRFMKHDRDEATEQFKKYLLGEERR